MLYSHFKYISKTQVLKLLKSKKDMTFFTNQEAIVIEYYDRSYHLFHIEDIYNIIKNNKLIIKTTSDFLLDDFLEAIVADHEVNFQFIAKQRYTKNSNINAMIDKDSFDKIIKDDKKLKEHYKSLKCFAIKNKVFFDSDDLIELLLNDKLTLSSKESSFLNDIKNLLLFHQLNRDLIAKKNNKLVKI